MATRHLSVRCSNAVIRPRKSIPRPRVQPGTLGGSARIRGITCPRPSLGTTTDGEPGDDWVLAYTPDQRDKAHRETVLIRLSPRALPELYVETKDLSPDACQAGHTAECDRCGDSVPLEKAVPNPRGDPVHRRCYVDAYGGPAWLKDY